MAGKQNAELDPRLMEALKGVSYPGFNLSLVEMQFITLARLEPGGKAVIKTRALAARPEVREALEDAIGSAVGSLEGVKELELEMPEPAAPKDDKPQGPQPIPGVKAVVPVASGKGGVGKSTVSVNLALGLAARGLKVGLLDLDLYGPSIPLMLGLTKAQATGDEGNRIVPIQAHGIKVLSIGFLVPADAALIWRGPMVAKAVKQLLRETAWGELDVLVLDLPPGTGDIQISLVSDVPVTGAVVVATPQEVALADVVKAVKMFQQVEAPILGVVENMSYLVCSECQARHEIFGHGTVKPLAQRLGVDFLGEIPLDPAVPSLADHGHAALEDAPASAQAYADLAEAVHKRLQGVLAKQGD